MSDTGDNGLGNETASQPLLASLEQITLRAAEIELMIRLDNPDTQRAKHYISDVRGISFDETTGSFVVRLTDQGAALVRRSVYLLPSFSRVDPSATALLSLRLPDSIIRMRIPDSPGIEVELERHELSLAAEIEVVIGWSDTPFYVDPRERTSDQLSVAAWETDQTRFIVPSRSTGSET
jgi:hypothetical protein